MLQRVVLNRPGLWSAVSAASVFTSRVSSYLTNSLGKLFPQGQRISKTTHPPSHKANGATGAHELPISAGRQSRVVVQSSLNLRMGRSHSSRFADSKSV